MWQVHVAQHPNVAFGVDAHTLFDEARRENDAVHHRGAHHGAWVALAGVGRATTWSATCPVSSVDGARSESAVASRSLPFFDLGQNLTRSPPLQRTGMVLRTTTQLLDLRHKNFKLFEQSSSSSSSSIDAVFVPSSALDWRYTVASFPVDTWRVYEEEEEDEDGDEDCMASTRRPASECSIRC